MFEDWRRGDDATGAALFAEVYPELLRYAHNLVRREQRPVSLATGDLANEALLRVLKYDRLSLNDRAHLVALTKRVMTHVMTDLARNRSRRGVRTTLSETSQVTVDEDGLRVQESLIRLKAVNTRLYNVAVLRHVFGFSKHEAAEFLGSSPSTVTRDWTLARAWLFDAIMADDE
ncbi:MAG: ECF-type sigma factor [Caulobacterales bacterium]